ncbi:MAG TPA: ECF-type sigma factor [Methylomirabilota bacterium]|nr:ECF-type sigma factor [Methylomirabilota bacterium]
MEQSPAARPAEDFLPLVYEELRRLAAARLDVEGCNRTLQPTALVHEAWLRLAPGGNGAFQNRAHFFAAAAEAMRRILIDRARRRLASKRGAGAPVVEFDEMIVGFEVADDDRLLALHEALEEFARSHPRKAKLVELRYFAGMTYEEAARALGIAEPTAKQWWSYSRAWLKVRLAREPLPE